MSTHSEETSVRKFLEEVSKPEHEMAFHGLVKTLRRTNGTIDGSCAASFLRHQLTESDSQDYWNIHTTTCLKPGVREEIIRQLGLQGLYH